MLPGKRPLPSHPKKRTYEKHILDECTTKIFSFRNTMHEQKDDFGMGCFFCSTLAKYITTKIKNFILSTLLMLDKSKYED